MLTPPVGNKLMELATYTTPEEREGNLIIKIVKANNLVNADIFDLSDPFCVVKVGEQSQKTKVIDNNLNPIWEEIFSFSCVYIWKK